MNRLDFAPATRRLESGTTVRLLSPMGLYPAQVAFRNPEAAIVVTPEIAALITKFSPVPEPEPYFYSEVEFLSAFEVRALASVLLCRKFETGGMCLYPVEEHCQIEDSIDLSKIKVLKKLLACLIAQLPADRSSRKAHAPPCVGGNPYVFNEHCEIDRRRFTRLFRSIDVEDHLLIRGLGTLVKAAMLSNHYEFLEHANIALWIALDASLRLLLREMRKAGFLNPTAKDAGALLDDPFDNPYASEGYFTDFYEDRIKTIHPESRYGTYPAAPLSVDDYYMLDESLRSVYEFLITGRVEKGWRERR